MVATKGLTPKNRGADAAPLGSLISGRVRSDATTSRNVLNMVDAKLVTKREWRLAIAFCAVWLCVGGPARTQEPSRPADALSPSPPRESANSETKPAVSAAALDGAGADKRPGLDSLPTSIRFLPNKLIDLVCLYSELPVLRSNQSLRQHE